MDWNDIAIIVGAGLVLAGAIASTPPSFRRWRHPAQKMHLRTTFSIESVGELCGRAVFLGGFVLIQVGILAEDLRHGASHQWLAFLLATSALMLLLCGAALSRLSLRWQLRADPASDAKSHEMSG